MTGRDITDYSGTDGIMVEGFGRWTDGGYFSVQDEDWQLQMDRILGMVNMDKIVILQQYVKEEDKRDRMFLLGNYLLTKGHHTYINLDFQHNRNGSQNMRFPSVHQLVEFRPQ